MKENIAQVEKFFNGSNQLVGQLKDGIYRKRVRKSLHLFKKYHGYGIDKNILDSLAGRCTEIRIFDMDSDTIYTASYEDFMKNGIVIAYDGMQVILPLTNFTHRFL